MLCNAFELLRWQFVPHEVWDLHPVLRYRVKRIRGFQQLPQFIADIENKVNSNRKVTVTMKELE